jgi:hypothetical protein
MRQILFTGLLIISALFSKAQNISMGPSVGFGHTWLINHEEVTGKFKSSWNAGLSFIYSGRTKFGFGADIKFSSEGNKSTYITASIPEEQGREVIEWYHINYIRIPIKIIYFFGKEGKVVRPHIYAGPSIGFLAGGHIIDDIGEVKLKWDTKDYIKGFDIGGIVAAGFSFKLASNACLSTDISYYHGFSDISNIYNNDHNRNVQLNIGLLFGIKKK